MAAHPARFRFRALQALDRLLFAAVSRLETSGIEHFPAAGPYLVAFNHLHWLDIPVLYAVLPHEVAAFMAQLWFRHPAIGPLARALSHPIPVETGVADHRAMAAARRWLETGGVILIAPEGARSRTGALSAGQPGAAYLASRAGVPVVPVAIWGHERAAAVWGTGRRVPVRVAVGPLVGADELSPRARSLELGAHTERIMRAIAVQLPAGYRGVFGEAGPGD
jgi:1-acyl-sn-glycerol-3-phosphate acyltransferase